MCVAAILGKDEIASPMQPSLGGTKSCRRAFYWP
jgi:hypothetical protein